MDPILSSATGAYDTRLPLESLRAHFSRTWFNEIPDVAAAIAVVPDGCIDLEWIDGTLRVAGPDREVQRETLPPGATVIGFRFCPGAARHWLRVTASEIVGARVPLEALWGSEARAIADWAACAANSAGVARRLEAAFERRATAIPAPDPLATIVQRTIEAEPFASDVVQRLCSELGASERTLRRRCHEAFGYGPKTLQRIVRFQRFLEGARNSDATLASLANELGYADQAHVTREARRLAGMTPTVLHAQLSTGGRFVQDGAGGRMQV